MWPSTVECRAECGPHATAGLLQQHSHPARLDRNTPRAAGIGLRAQPPFCRCTMDYHRQPWGGWVWGTLFSHHFCWMHLPRPPRRGHEPARAANPHCQLQMPPTGFCGGALCVPAPMCRCDVGGVSVGWLSMASCLTSCASAAACWGTWCTWCIVQHCWHEALELFAQRTLPLCRHVLFSRKQLEPRRKARWPACCQFLS